VFLGICAKPALHSLILMETFEKSILKKLDSWLSIKLNALLVFLKLNKVC